MTIEKAKKFFQEQKDEGQTEDEILGTLYAMFVDDSINLEQLEVLVNVLGYEITDEFKNMSPEDQKTKGWAKEEKKYNLEDDEIFRGNNEELKDITDELFMDDEPETKGMTSEEAKAFLLNERANGASDKEILWTLYEMFKAGDINVEELGILVSFLGYELTEEFKNMSPEDQKTKGWGDEEDEDAKQETEVPKWLR